MRAKARERPKNYPKLNGYVPSVFMTAGFELLKAYEWTDALCQM